jgi:hypothetical protein
MSGVRTQWQPLDWMCIDRRTHQPEQVDAVLRGRDHLSQRRRIQSGKGQTRITPGIRSNRSVCVIRA